MRNCINLINHTFGVLFSFLLCVGLSSYGGDNCANKSHKVTVTPGTTNSDLCPGDSIPNGTYVCDCDGSKGTATPNITVAPNRTTSGHVGVTWNATCSHGEKGHVVGSVVVNLDKRAKVTPDPFISCFEVGTTTVNGEEKPLYQQYTGTMYHYLCPNELRYDPPPTATGVAHTECVHNA